MTEASGTKCVLKGYSQDHYVKVADVRSNIMIQHVLNHQILHILQVDGKLIVSVQVDDVDSDIFNQQETYQLVDRLSDLVELPEPGSSVELELEGQRETLPTR